MKVSAKKISAAVSLAVMSAGISMNAGAAGFALIENSASGMGNAFAGAAAIAEDASTIWFNPAGMTKLSGSQIVIAGHIISPTADFTNNGSTTNTAQPLSGGDDDGGQTGFVPNFYYVKNLGNDVVFGVGVNAPFGLATEYDENWVGRYTALESEVMTININPSFAMKATNKLSVGFGLNIQYIEATLSNKLDSAAICQGRLVPLGVPSTTCDSAGLTVAEIGNPTLDSNLDSAQSLSGDDWSTGFNLGFLYDIDDASRLGVAYRSSIKQKLEGDVNFDMNAGLAAIISGLPSPYNTLFPGSTGVQSTIELPESISVSYYRDVDAKLAFLADITWTRWSNFEELAIVFDPIQPASIVPEDWENSFRYSLGINYKHNDTMTYRAGIAYDETPIKSPAERTPRIPGNDRTWLSLGFGYNMSSDMSIDVGYSHLFVDDTDMDNTDASFGHTVTGTYEASVDILSAQLNMKF
ncbi:MAG TPA: outer membrane protein transport protein [Gammaproteobacteria bacterium]